MSKIDPESLTLLPRVRTVWALYVPPVNRGDVYPSANTFPLQDNKEGKTYEPLASLFKLSLAITCPHGSIIGQLVSVACSLLTGHVKME